MNLKRTLRTLYYDQPPLETKRFARQLLHNAAWQQLHPIRAAFFTRVWLSSSLVVVSSLAVAGSGIGMIGMLLHSGDPQPPESPAPPEPPVLIAEETAPTEASTRRADASATASTPKSSTASAETTAPQTSSAVTDITAAQTAPIVTDAAAVPLPAQTSLPAAETETQTVPITEVPTEPRAIATAALCRHDAVPLDLLDYFLGEKIVTDYEFCGYPEHDTADVLELTDTEFADWAIFLSEDIFMGTILSREENVVEGKPWTCLTVQADAPLKGTLSADEPVRIWMAGGTMPLADYLAVYPDDETFAGWNAERITNTDLYEPGAFSTEYAVGESYLWFVHEDYIAPKGTPGMEDMVLTPTFGSDVTILRTDGENFVCANPYQSFSMEQQALVDRIR